MTTDSVEQRTLESKRHDEEEYFVNLFEWCNLNCPFCWQNHNSKLGLFSIESKKHDLSKLIKESPRSKHVVNLMGGELFMDEVPDWTFENYFNLVADVHRQAEATGNTVKFNFVTNLVFTKTGRVQRLLDACRSNDVDAMLATSWDPVGRFNSENLETFKQHCNVFQHEIRIISVVMTKQCIDWFLYTGKDRSVFEQLYTHFDIYFDTYSPEARTDMYAPSDSQMLAMYLSLIQFYPGVYPVKDWIQDRTTTMECRSSHIIGPGGYTGKCGSLVPKPVLDEMAVPVNVLDNASMEDNFVRENECLSCEFYGECGLGCFLLHNLKGRADTKQCIFKTINTLLRDRADDN